MQRLSGLDASFLYLETPSQVMNVAAIVEVDPSTIPGGYTFNSLRLEMERRVRGLPMLRRRLADSLTNVDHPVWVEDEDFDIERHVHRIAVPAPGGIEEMAALCGHLVAQVMDRKKPLWDLWVLEGLSEGAIALVLRMHHACVDGATVAEILGELATSTPEPSALDAARVKESAGGASRPGMAFGGAVNFFVQRPIAAMKLIPKTLPVPFEWFKRVRSGDGMPAPFLAPRTRFNGPLTPRRNLAFARLPLGDVKRVKDHFGVKVNDVVLAMAGGALREYLQTRGELPEEPLVGLVPVSLRGVTEDDLIETGTNKVTGMFTRLPTSVADPVERIRLAGKYARQAKGHHQGIDANLLRAYAEFAPGNTLGALMRLYSDRRLSGLHPPIFNAVISNVAGPDYPMYLLGARVKAVYPMGPIFHGLGLNITVMSVDGELNVGLLSCPDLSPDLWDLVRGFGTQLEELVAAVEADANGDSSDDGPSDTGRQSE
ncbi:WS/DGAT/MGAT family O-acyltransferase [Gordonia sp. LUNF6]|uniref:WS/DGAT/MGAT family O-acyltransferase n=1 Tax=Gordonia sp. LUNF6 TaxID=3388658 RepID=UPI00399BA886